MDLLTLDDVNTKGKKVLLRLDINCPIDPKSGEILDDSRIKSHIPTLEALQESRVAIIAHQSRPGKSDFTTLEAHAKRLEKLLGKKVKYVDDVFGSTSAREIRRMKDGDILMLENVRFCSEEMDKDITSRPPKEQAKTNLVRNLSGYVELYVNDAFAVSHRSQPSVVAFPAVLPSCAGRVMEREVKALSSALSAGEGPKVFLLGGVKVDDSLRVIQNVLNRRSADRVLVGGLVAHLFMAAGHDIGNANLKELEGMGYKELIPEAKKVLEKHKGKVKMPSDVAFQKGGERQEAAADEIADGKIMDIGTETIKEYSAELKKARMVVANGPMGVFETKGFEKGTEELLRTIGGSAAFSIIGGGHISAVVEGMNLSKKISHISTGGGACMSFLAGEALPGIVALEEAKGGFRR